MKTHLNYIVVFTPTSRGRLLVNRIVTKAEIKAIKDSARRNSITPIFAINYSTGFTAETRKLARISRRRKVLKFNH